MIPLPEDLRTSAMDEELARAELYGLLAQFYYGAPDATLWAELQVAVTESPVGGSYLEEPWRMLVGVARTLPEADVREEYDRLFGGVGKPDVYLYASHYLSGFLNEKPLAALRTELIALGIERDEAMAETEDHFAFLCEVMRYLIAGDDVSVSNLERQRSFFAMQIQPWANAMCDALQAHPEARFYAAVAGLTRAFLAVETQSFDMLG